MNKRNLDILIEQAVKQVVTKDDFVEVTTDRQKKNGTKAFVQRGYREPKYTITKQDDEYGTAMNLRRSDMTSNIQKYDYDTDYNIAIEDMVKYHNKSRKYNKRQKIEKSAINGLSPEINNLLEKSIKGSYRVENGVINVNGSVDLDSYHLKSIPVQFGIVSGDFSCYSNKLTSLKGCPTEVGGNFDCNENKLTSLEYMPMKIGKRIWCQTNKLTSLYHCPSIVDSDFNCGGNQLISLEGGPKQINGNFYCYGNQLTTLKGGPLEVTGYYNCSNNKLTSLIGAPNFVGRTFNISENEQLTTLNSFPISVGDIDLRLVTLILSDNLFRNLRGVKDIGYNTCKKLKDQIPIQFGITDETIIDEIWQSYMDILEGKRE